MSDDVDRVHEAKEQLAESIALFTEHHPVNLELRAVVDAVAELAAAVASLSSRPTGSEK